MDETQNVLRALQAVAGPVVASLPFDRDLVVALALNGRDILRMFELVEEGSGVTFLPSQVIDWAIGLGSVTALVMLVRLQRLASATGSDGAAQAAPRDRPGFCGPPGSMGRVR